MTDTLIDQNFVEKVRNPITGRLIKRGSKIYNELVNNGYIELKTEKISKKFSPVRNYKIPNKIQDYPVDHSDVKWGTKKPHKVGQKDYIKKNCGESCFLMPQFNKFPICNKTLPCTYNCRGLKAASSRAGEWKYLDILEKSKQLTKKFDCYKKKK